MVKKIHQNLRGKRGLFILLILLTIVLQVCHSNLVDLKWLQQQELAFFDYAQIRANYTPKEERIVIVGITEEDMRQLQVDTLEDKTLATLIDRIKQQQPRVIGLDVVRDLPVGEGQEQLEEIFRDTSNLYGVGKFTGLENDAYYQKIDPPPILGQEKRVGDVSIMVDDDGVVRRGNFFPTTGEKGVPSLGLILAHRYLVENGYKEKTAPSGDLQLGEVVFPTFEASDGGYLNADASGYQILMNWYHPSQSLPLVSVTDVLSGNFPDDFFQDKIVLIGYYTISVKKDIFYSPFSNKVKNQTPRGMFGVEIHANLADYVLSSVMDGKPLLKAVGEPIEALNLTFWILITGILVWLLKVIKPPLALVGAGLTLAAILGWFYGQLNYYIFVRGWWLPIFPRTAMIITAIASLFYIFRERNLEHIKNLELKIKERTSELELALRDLQQQKNQLLEQQKQLIEQEKLAFLGRLTAGFCHQFKNPLYALKYSFQTISNLLSDVEKLETEEARENLKITKELLSCMDEPIDKLELLFKLILISPTRKNIVWLEAKPNNFVSSIIASCFRFKFLDKTRPNIKIEKELDSALEEKILVPQQLEIPIFNILDNALDALLNRINEDDFAPFIQVKTRKLENQWQITIRDNGGGIPESIQKSLFEPFVTTKPETHGIGLGLWISKEMIHQTIGGQISVAVKEEWTKFTLTIPFK